MMSHLNFSLRRTFLAMLLTSACAVVARAESQAHIDLSAPQDADDALIAAIRVGDAQTIREVTDYPAFWEPVIDALAQLGKRKVELAKAVTQRWDEQALQEFTGLHDVPLPDGYVLKITGDTATMVDEKYPDFPTPQRYRKVE